MQSLMEGLSLSLLKHGPVKVFADKRIGDEDYDKKSSLNITRISGLKIFRKYRKASLNKDFSLKNSMSFFFSIIGKV